MTFLSKTLTTVFSAAVLACAATSASADTVNLSHTGSQWGSKAVTVDDHPDGKYDLSTNAGAFNMNVTSPVPNPGILGMGSVIAWCVELTETLKTGPLTYDVHYATAGDKPNADAGWLGNVQRLFNAYYDTVQTAANATMSAAFQLAVWELTVRNNNWNVDGYNGSGFHAKAPTAVVNQANTWLTALKNNTATATNSYQLVYLSNTKDKAQDLLVAVSAVPLPGAALMFLSALGLGGLARRKQAAKSPLAC